MRAMTAENNGQMKNDRCVKHFLDYLASERNASPHTISNYLLDIEQFVKFIRGDKANAGVKWDDADVFTARKFLIEFQKRGNEATTTARKLASLRSFYRFLVREEYVEVNPFGGLRAPKRSRKLPEILSVAEVDKLIRMPAKIVKKPAGKNLRERSGPRPGRKVP